MSLCCEPLDRFIKFDRAKYIELFKQLKEETNDLLTNDRKTYYQDQGIDNLKFYYHYFLLFIYVIVVLIYVVYNFFSGMHGNHFISVIELENYSTLFNTELTPNILFNKRFKNHLCFQKVQLVF